MNDDDDDDDVWQKREQRGTMLLSYCCSCCWYYNLNSPMTPVCLGTLTDASTVMVATRLLPYAMSSSDDSDWHVHDVVLP